MEVQNQCGSNVNGPKHYGGDTVINYMESIMTAEQFEGFLRGNIIKYITRYDKKNGVEDLRKAEWYLQKLIKHIEDRGRVLCER